MAETAFNPKTDPDGFSKRRRANGVAKFIDLKNPIPDEVSDPQELSATFSEMGIVPYAGAQNGTGDRLLAWYQMLAKLSPTHGSCMGKKTLFAFGSKAKFRRQFDPEFDLENAADATMTADERARYYQAIQQFFDFEGGFTELHRQLSFDYQSFGNCYVKLSLARKGKEVKINIRRLKNSQCRFLKTKAGEAKTLAISPVWTADFLRKNEPEKLPVYPVFKEVGGVISTAFHLKTGDGNWYGKPESQSADLFKFREVQDVLYLVKITENNFTGRIIIEVEDDDPTATGDLIDDGSAKENGFGSFVERFEENFSNKSDDPQTVVITSRPYGSKPMFVFNSSGNQDYLFFREIGKVNEEKILRAHSCTPRFMGFDIANGFASDVFVSDYVMNMEPIIEALHSDITRFTNWILDVGWKLVGLDGQFEQFSFYFTPPIISAIEKYKKGQDGAAIVDPV